MNLDDFEKKLARQPMRPLPPHWREEILAATRAATSPVAPWWREWLWPCPQAWAGMAAVWTLILGLNLAAGQASTPAVAGRVACSREELQNIERQEQTLARLVAPEESQPPAEPPKRRPQALNQRGESLFAV